MGGTHITLGVCRKILFGQRQHVIIASNLHRLAPRAQRIYDLNGAMHSALMQLPVPILREVPMGAHHGATVVGRR